MCLACPGLAVEKEVVSVLDENAFGEIRHGYRCRGLNFREVEIGERFEFREVCGFDVATDGECVPSADLALNQLNQEITPVALFAPDGLDERLSQLQAFAPRDRLLVFFGHNAPCPPRTASGRTAPRAARSLPSRA